LFGISWMQAWLKKKIDQKIKGPNEQERTQGRTRVWGEAKNLQGQVVTARLQTANGYDVTVHGTVMAIKHLLDYTGPGGYFTPSRLFGARCVEALPGSGKIELS